MRHERIDPAQLRRPAVATLAALAVGAFLAWHADAGRVAALRAHAAALAERDGQRTLIAQVANGEYRRQLGVLSAMQERGLIGEEARADWIRLLHEVAGERLITDLRHELSPPRPISAGGTGNLQYQSSRMRLQMLLLHEGDLLHVIGQLQQRARAVIQVRACELARLSDRSDAGAAAANLDTICQLDWITVRHIGDNR